MATEAPERVIAIGGSAGGLGPMREIVRALPSDFPAAVLVVLHIPSEGSSALDRILDRAATMPAARADDHQALEGGHIYVAPPDRHMTVTGGHIHLSRGPSYNGHRPAIDPLFRSVASEYGSRAVAVVLSGARDDGSAGLAAVSTAGGTTIVQDPGEAMYESMPRAAIARDHVKHVVRVEEIGPLLVESIMNDPTRGNRSAWIVTPEGPPPDGAPPSVFTCPDCSGTLFEIDENGTHTFRCRVGHGWTIEALHAQQAASVEHALYTALRVLEERIDLNGRMVERARQGERHYQLHYLDEQAAALRRDAEAIRNLLERTAHPDDLTSDVTG